MQKKFKKKDNIKKRFYRFINIRHAKKRSFVPKHAPDNERKEIENHSITYLSHYWFKRNFYPDNGTSGAQVCSISGKRRDCIWGEWTGEMIIVNYDYPNREYKRYRERNREPMASHGGSDCTGEPEEVP